ncbi:hypothetical protein K438DRAFT_1995094 [Mycena galopus ATCC 62051]|nr:hypothetical protein K438DRAFT_1995094 [Mycena galopus ATCC 62051]
MANKNNRSKKKDTSKGNDSKGAEEPDDMQPKKRGQASDFKGEHLKFLTTNIPMYIAASKKKGSTTSKTEGLTAFWPEDPPPAPETPEPPADNPFDMLDLNLSKEEEDRKSEIQTKTKQKVKRWFLRQCPGAVGIHGNPYFVHLARLQQDHDAGPPRRLADFQFYMRHPESRDAVVEHFEDKYGDEPRSQQLAFRCKAAQELLAEEPQDVKDCIRKECDKAHTKDLEAYKECCENFISIVQPLLMGLQEYTGLTLNIIGARINEETKEFETMSANSGVVDSKDWPRWDPEGYAGTLKTYRKFVHAGDKKTQNVTNGPVSEPPPAGGCTVPPPRDSMFVVVNLFQFPPDATQDVMKVGPGPAARLETQDVEMDPSPVPPIAEDEVDARLASGYILPPHPHKPRALQLQVHPHPQPLRRADSSSRPTRTRTCRTYSSFRSTRTCSRSLALALALDLIGTSSQACSSSQRTRTGSLVFVFITAICHARSSARRKKLEMWGLPRMGDELRAEILEMEHEEQRRYIAHLHRLSPGHLEREISLARNKKRALDLELFKLSGLFGMKRKGREKGGKKKRRRRDDDEEWDDEDDDDSEEEEEEEEEEEDSGEGGEKVEPTPVKTRRTTTAAERAAVLKGSGAVVSWKAAGWAEHGKKILSDEGMGAEWEALVQAWWTLEELWKFATSTKCHPTVNRPKAVGVWVKNARKGVPDIGTTGEMETQCGMGTPSEAWKRAVVVVTWVLGEMVVEGQTSSGTNEPPPIDDVVGGGSAAGPPVTASDQNGLNGAATGMTTTTSTTATASAGDAGPEPDPGNFAPEDGNSPLEAEILQNGCPTGTSLPSGPALSGSAPPPDSPPAPSAAGQTRSASAKGCPTPRPAFRGARRRPG